LRKGLNVSKNLPLEIVTDGLPSYVKAIEKEFSSTCGNVNSKIIHLQGPLTGPLNNNKIERFYGTLKGRVKAMGHLNNVTGAKIFTKGFPIYYNFIREHEALNGRTPAEVARLSPKKLSWMYLIQKASKS
jgi:transposase-like protein